MLFRTSSVVIYDLPNAGRDRINAQEICARPTNPPNEPYYSHPYPDSRLVRQCPHELITTKTPTSLVRLLFQRGSCFVPSHIPRNPLDPPNLTFNFRFNPRRNGTALTQSSVFWFFGFFRFGFGFEFWSIPPFPESYFNRISIRQRGYYGRGRPPTSYIPCPIFRFSDPRTLSLDGWTVGPLDF